MDEHQWRKYACVVKKIYITENAKVIVSHIILKDLTHTNFQPMTNKLCHAFPQIAGSRMKNPSKSTVEDIRQLLGEQYYVPLLRDDDLCLLPRVGSPWSPQLDSPTNPSPSNDWFFTSSPLSSTSDSPISPSLKVCVGWCVGGTFFSKGEAYS